HGYIALEDFNMSMQVTAITHKKKPVFVSIISQVTPSESSVIKKVAYEPMFLSHLRDQLGIKGIHAVSLHEPLSNVRPVIFLKFAQGAPRTEVWRALHGASGLRADCGKIVVAVSDDIDPTNTDAVWWSIAYRANPVEGGWEQSGKETFAQKRGGLTPETPVRDADKPDKGGH